jgi:hypothetical protein
MTGDEFRDQLGALLRTRYENVETEVALPGKKADIYFEISVGPAHKLRIAAECKLWSRPLNRDTVSDIIKEYGAALQSRIDQLWIICQETPAAGARQYVAEYKNCQIMTAIECEQAIVDFTPLLTFLANDFKRDAISNYYIPPTYYGPNNTKEALHEKISEWLGMSVSIISSFMPTTRRGRPAIFCTLALNQGVRSLN